MSGDFDSAFQQLTEEVIELGYDGVLYSFYPKPLYVAKDIQPMLHFSDAFAPFVEHYINNDFGNRDFVLRLAMRGRRKPIDWWHEINAGNVYPEEVGVTEIARELFGIQQGLSIPVLSGIYAIAGISVVSKNKDSEYFATLKGETAKDLEILAKEYHAKVLLMKEELQFFIRPLLENLDVTRKEVLKHLILGKPLKSIGGDISEKYAEQVLMKIRRDFGGISRNELLYILGMMNMYEYL
jgi:hypothetical protein